VCGIKRGLLESHVMFRKQSFSADLPLGKRGFIRFCHSREGGNPVKSSGWVPALAEMTNKSAFP